MEVRTVVEVLLYRPLNQYQGMQEDIMELTVAEAIELRDSLDRSLKECSPPIIKLGNDHPELTRPTYVPNEYGPPYESTCCSKVEETSPRDFLRGQTCESLQGFLKKDMS